MIQVNELKGILQAYSEKNNGVLIDTRWFNTHGIVMSELHALRKKAIIAELGEEGKITSIKLDPSVVQQSFPRKNFGRSDEENRRIARQATLNTATAIYDLALRTSAGGFTTPEATSPVVIAHAIKIEVMKIASELEEHVYR